MPDLQSELSKIAHAWDSHEQMIRQPQAQTQANPKESQVNLANVTSSTTTTTTTTTTPVQQAHPTIVRTGFLSRDIHAYLAAKPSTQVETAKAMASIGHKENSAHSVMSQMLKSGLVTFDDATRTLHVISQTYTPVRNPYKTNPVGKFTRTKTPAKMVRAKTPAPVAKPAGLAAIKVDAAPQAETAQPQQLANPARLVRLQTAAEVLTNMSVTEAHKLYIELSKLFGGK